MTTAAASPGSGAANPPFPGATSCSLPGVRTAAWCGVVSRPLDPARPDGLRIDVHLAVVPALARVKKPDALVFLAGGPGQSAIDLAGPALGMVGRLAQRRDVVLVDQRGTGRSAPLTCPGDAAHAAWRPLAEQWSEPQRMAELQACRQALQRLPHGDLRHYTTPVAVGDLVAVLDHLRLDQVNVVAGSYGTRVGLELLRQAPQRVRRSVLDGVAPADMRLPEAGEVDVQTAFVAVMQACAADPTCGSRWPDLAQRWQRLTTAAPREVDVVHPWSGERERVTITPAVLAALVRAPLYAPALSAQLPAAIAAASDGVWTPLVGLASAMQTGGRRGQVASGMHFSVACAEDVAPAGPGQKGGQDDTAANSGAWGLASLYRTVCADWPRAQMDPGYVRVQPAVAPVWLLSGGRDPVTPPRHGQRVQVQLGDNAVHTVVGEAGHGVLGLACIREAVGRFVDAADAGAALRVARDAQCAERLPRPGVFFAPAGAGHAGTPPPGAPK